MDYENMYCVVESGGSLGEIDNLGRYRVIHKTIYADKEMAKKDTRYMSSKFGGGYYDYHYATKTVAWALKNCEKFDITKVTVLE